MIQQLSRRFQSLDRDVNALGNILGVFLLILVARAIQFVYEGQYNQLGNLLGSATPLIAALLITRVANRLIVNGDIIRENDRRQEIARTTHHLIAITQDLRARVEYIHVIFKDGGHPAIAITQIAATIEDRYNTLLERDAYKVLPGTCIDIITRLSGSIFGIGVIACGFSHTIAVNPTVALSPIPRTNNDVVITKLEEVMSELQSLIDELFALRTSLDEKNSVNGS